MDIPAPPATAVPIGPCLHCGKPATLCLCASIEPIDNRLFVMVLQHPQEQDQDLGTGRLTRLHLRNADLRIGLSWPSLSKLVGRPADPKKWAVLYLGPLKAIGTDRDVVAVDRKGQPLSDQDGILAALEGVIVLDGTWGQAKTLWWRNPWLLKTRRVLLNPRFRSAYGNLRKEPRHDSISTIEATALLLARLERREEILLRMQTTFRRLIDRYRGVSSA